MTYQFTAKQINDTLSFIEADLWDFGGIDSLVFDFSRNLNAKMQIKKGRWHLSNGMIKRHFVNKPYDLDIYDSIFADVKESFINTINNIKLGLLEVEGVDKARVIAAWETINCGDHFWDFVEESVEEVGVDAVRQALSEVTLPNPSDSYSPVTNVKSLADEQQFIDSLQADLDRLKSAGINFTAEELGL